MAFLKLYCFFGYPVSVVRFCTEVSSNLLAGDHKPGCQHSGSQVREKGRGSKYSDYKLSYYTLYPSRFKGLTKNGYKEL